MKVVKGKVIDGKVVVDGSLPEGSTVTVLAPEGDASFELSPDDEAALIESIAEAERGEVVDADTVLRKLGTQD